MRFLSHLNGLPGRHPLRRPVSRFRYWRIWTDQPALAGGGEINSFQVAEIEMFSAPDGSGPDLTSPAWAICSSNYAGFPDSSAFDDSASYWADANPGGTLGVRWIGQAFPSAQAVRSLRFTGAFYAGRPQFPAACQLQRSNDGVAWVKAADLAFANTSSPQLLLNL